MLLQMKHCLSAMHSTTPNRYTHKPTHTHIYIYTRKHKESRNEKKQIDTVKLKQFLV